LSKNAVESPDSGQPKLEVQAGSNSGVRLVSWLGARKMLVPDGEAGTLGMTDEAAVGAAGALGVPAAAGDAADVGDPAGVLAVLAAVELADELQAVTSKAAQTSPDQRSTAPAAPGRDGRDFVVNIDFPVPLTSNSGSVSHVISTTFAVTPWLEIGWAGR
jgi:hypothetical protein